MDSEDSLVSRQVGIPFGVGLLAALASGAFFAVITVLESPYGPVVSAVREAHSALWWQGYTVLLVTLSVGLAVACQKPTRSAALVFGAGFGVGVNLGGIGISGEIPGLAFRLRWGLVVGTAIVVVVWLPSHLLGRGLAAVLRK